MRAIPPITITASNRPIPEAGLPVRTIRTTRSAAMTPITATPNSSFLSMPSFSPTPLRPATQDAQNSAGRCAMRSSEIGADLLTGPQYIYPFFDNKYLGGQKEAGENPARPRHCNEDRASLGERLLKYTTGVMPWEGEQLASSQETWTTRAIPTFPWGDGQGPRQVG